MGLELRRPDRAFTIRQLCLEFRVTPRALRFYEDKGLLSPAREGLNRVYHNRDRARLQLILRGKRVGFSLAEIREMLDLYDEKDGGAAQMASSLARFRAKILELKEQRVDLDGAIGALEDGCVRLEKQLSALRPDLLPQAADYESALKTGLESVPGHPAE
jgi:DNA-binding transcriptional MerR regulator